MTATDLIGVECKVSIVNRPDIKGGVIRAVTHLNSSIALLVQAETGRLYTIDADFATIDLEAEQKKRNAKLHAVRYRGCASAGSAAAQAASQVATAKLKADIDAAIRKDLESDRICRERYASASVVQTMLALGFDEKSAAFMGVAAAALESMKRAEAPSADRPLMADIPIDGPTTEDEHG